MMPVAQTLPAQLAAADLELERLRIRLAILQEASPALYRRFRLVLEPKLDECITELKRLAEWRGAPAPSTWRDFASTRAKCDELLSESLDFIQGALIRQASLDDGLCVIADAMLDDLSVRSCIDWGRLSVPADSEFVTDLAQIVRIRSGDVSVWHLPVAAHEFGHFIGPRISAGTIHPFAELLGKYPVGSVRWSYAHEYFADTFATYAIGPSYAAACIVSRFHPGDAMSVSQTHPPHARRVFLMLRVLDTMDRGYGAIAEYLRATWKANVNGAGQSGELDRLDENEVAETADTYYRILDLHLWGVRYAGMNHARQAEKFILGAGAAPGPTASIADILNGAWLSRIDNATEDRAGLRRRGQIALELATRVVEPMRATAR